MPCGIGEAKDVGAFDRLDLAVLLRDAERDLAPRGGRDRQLQMPLIELAADRHDERHEEFVQPFAAEIHRASGQPIEEGTARNSPAPVCRMLGTREPSCMPIGTASHTPSRSTWISNLAVNWARSSSQDPVMEIELML